MTAGMTLLFALIGGFAVGNLYWAQPLLQVIGGDLGVSTGTAGTLVTFTQIGYALGIVLIVPLADVANRRRLIPLMRRCTPARCAGRVPRTSLTSILENPRTRRLLNFDQSGQVAIITGA